MEEFGTGKSVPDEEQGERTKAKGKHKEGKDDGGSLNKLSMISIINQYLLRILE